LDATAILWVAVALNYFILYKFHFLNTMKHKITLSVMIMVAVTTLLSSCNQQSKNGTSSKETISVTDPLPSWNEGASKQAIIDFVTKITKEGTADFVPVTDRIACFDNDGALWSEQPMYFQMAFAIDQVKTMAPQHPEWKTKQPFKALLDGDLKAVLAGGEHALLEIIMVTHAGMTTDEFSQVVKDWISSAKHPKTGKLYKEMVFQPMLELLSYLRANGYKTFIVSGGGVDFIRPWAEEVYGIPGHQVVGSSGQVKYAEVNGKVTLIKLPEINFVDDKEGKPIGIHQYIGKRPVFAAGNSDGDYAMLKWTAEGEGPRFAMLIHHTDSIREYAYDRESSNGRLNKGLDDATKYNWRVIDMNSEWKAIYPYDKE